MSGERSTTSLGLRYGFLDHIGPELRKPTLEHLHGDLVARGQAVGALREALLSGRVPDDDALQWPAPHLKTALLAGMRGSGIAEPCLGDPQTVDAVVAYALDAINEAYKLEERALVALTPRVLDGACGGGAFGERSDGPPFFYVEGAVNEESARPGATEAVARARPVADGIVAQLGRTLVEGKTRQWADRALAWREVRDLLAALTRAAGIPGKERGILRSFSWDALLRLRRLFGELDAVVSLIERLGRLAARDDAATEGTLAQIRRAVAHVQTRTELALSLDDSPEIRGVERGDAIARMLPSEAVLLSHPTLRLLWHARRSERSLLVYHAPGVLTERLRDRQTSVDAEESEGKPVDRGPVVLVIDTSGSMMGGPEEAVKAVALQVLGVAFLEQRKCYVYMFSGPEQTIEQELAFDENGLARTLEFLSWSFHGGTVPDAALLRAIERLRSHEWRHADLLFASDGFFAVAPHTQREIQRLKRHRNLKIHAVVAGEGDGFDQLSCDERHLLTDWCRSFGRAP